FSLVDVFCEVGRWLREVGAIREVSAYPNKYCADIGYRIPVLVLLGVYFGAKILDLALELDDYSLERCHEEIELSLRDGDGSGVQGVHIRSGVLADTLALIGASLDESGDTSAAEHQGQHPEDDVCYAHALKHPSLLHPAGSPA